VRVPIHNAPRSRYRREYVRDGRSAVLVRDSKRCFVSARSGRLALCICGVIEVNDVDVRWLVAYVPRARCVNFVGHSTTCYFVPVVARLGTAAKIIRNRTGDYTRTSVGTEKQRQTRRYR